MDTIAAVKLEALPISQVRVRGGRGWIYLWNTHEYQILWKEKPRGMNRLREQKIIRETMAAAELVRQV